MERDERSGLDELAAAVARARVAGLVDVFLERRAEVTWRFAGGRVASLETLLQEGAAVRRGEAFAASDGLDRPALAALLGVSSRVLPPVALPRCPAPPALEAMAPFPAAWHGVRWRCTRAAVLAGGRAAVISRPELAEVTFGDGRRALACWPPPAGGDGEPARPLSPAPPGRARVLLAPPAAAVLAHELFGHPLEGDILVRGGSPWAGRAGHRLMRLALSITDDPTRGDLPGAFSADDEGEAAAPRPLLERGVLVGALADRRTAAALGVPAGNARRAGVHAPPRPRMSNLIIEAAAPLAEPPRDEAAIEVTAVSAGALEPAAGVVVLHARTAFALRRGRRARALAPFTLIGRAVAVARGVIAASGPPVASGEPGWCGKDGESVATGAAAPWLLVEGLELR